jgi:hypothetical protein
MGDRKDAHHSFYPRPLSRFRLKQTFCCGRPIGPTSGNLRASVFAHALLLVVRSISKVESTNYVGRCVRTRGCAASVSSG